MLNYKKHIGFDKKYFFIFFSLFIIEVLIALYVHDEFIRPFFGDFLVVILIYCFVMSFVKWNNYKIAFLVLIFAFSIEFLQYINFVTIIGLQKSKLLRTVIGTSFVVADLLFYFLGFLTIISLEQIFKKSNSKCHLVIPFFL